MKIVIITPTYNEKENIHRLIPILEHDILPKVHHHEMHILVVDDHSPDGTAHVVREYMHKWKNLHLLEGDKQGLGVAYVRGMHYAMDHLKADAVIEFDADFQHDPHDIPRLIQAMDDGADYVIGSRYVPGGAIPKEWGIHRKIISRFGGLFAQLMLWTWNIHDMTSGYKLTKTSYLKNVDLDHLFSKYYAYKMHILHDIVKQKAKVTEVPIIFYERKEGSSKITRKDLFDSFYVVIRLRLRDSARVIKFLFVGGTGFVIQFLVLHFLNKAGVNQANSTMISAEAAILSNFFLNNAWTFSDTRHIKEQGGFLTRLVKFNVASLASIIVQGGISALAVLVFGPTLNILNRHITTSEFILFPTILLIVIPLNYYIYNKIIWKTQFLKTKPNLKPTT